MTDISPKARAALLSIVDGRYRRAFSNQPWTCPGTVDISARHARELIAAGLAFTFPSSPGRQGLKATTHGLEMATSIRTRQKAG